MAAKSAGQGLFLATPENARNAIAYWSAPGIVIPEVGLPADPLKYIQSRENNEPLRIVWTGLHVPRKALNLALRALAGLPPSTNWELHILGEGSQTNRWKKLAGKLGIATKCQFHGWLPRDKAMTMMHEAHVMLITSLRDLTATVTVEALALGLPIICLDHCGFTAVGDASCGVKVPVISPQQVITDITEAVKCLEENEDKRQLLATGALKRAAQFTWEDKARTVDRLYRAKLE